MRRCAPGVVLGKLVAAGAADTLEARQLVAAPALLAEALRLAAVLEAGQLQVHLADATALVVRAQRAQLAPAALHLCTRARPLGSTPGGTLSSADTAAAQAENKSLERPPAPLSQDATPQHMCTFHLLSMVDTRVSRFLAMHRIHLPPCISCPGHLAARALRRRLAPYRPPLRRRAGAAALGLRLGHRLLLLLILPPTRPPRPPRRGLRPRVAPDLPLVPHGKTAV